MATNWEKVVSQDSFDEMNTKVGNSTDGESQPTLFGKLLGMRNVADWIKNTWTAAKAGLLDVAVSSRAPGSTALSTSIWTSARAGKLDKLDMNISDIDKKMVMSGRKIFTKDGIFSVPEGVKKVYITACAAGGPGGPGVIHPSSIRPGGKAGEFSIRKEFDVSNKQSISIVVGRGNTIIDNKITLLSNQLSFNYENEILGLGFITGVATGSFSPSGVLIMDAGAGYSGLFGFGGRNGYNVGQVVGGDEPLYNGVKSGDGGYLSPGAIAPLIKPPIPGTVGLTIPEYDSGGAGGMGAGNVGATDYPTPGGGGAGGYGAGGGSGGLGKRTDKQAEPGQGSGGIVLIEWE